MYDDAKVTRQLTAELSNRKFRDANGPEIVALIKAAGQLQARGLISSDAHALLGDFLGSGSLKLMEI
jgi:hypothetical protein